MTASARLGNRPLQARGLSCTVTAMGTAVLKPARNMIRFDVTDAGGFYLFDNLDPGTYFVWSSPVTLPTRSTRMAGTPACRSGVCAAGTAVSSQVQKTLAWPAIPYTPNMDSDDNGVDTNTPELNGVYQRSDCPHPRARLP